MHAVDGFETRAAHERLLQHVARQLTILAGDAIEELLRGHLCVAGFQVQKPVHTGIPLHQVLSPTVSRVDRHFPRRYTREAPDNTHRLRITQRGLVIRR